MLLTFLVWIIQVNCNDDKGVLLGRWTDDYDGGVSPMSWKGSVEILRNWDTSACQPVRYGQCWVFAAVACSGKHVILDPLFKILLYSMGLTIYFLSVLVHSLKA